MADKIKILVADKLSTLGTDWLEAQDDVEVLNKPGMSPEELAETVREYDGMIVRSAVQAKGDVIANPGRLKGIARAGVGVDNIDIPTCTQKGIIVMNTPDGNTLSTAELAWALILSMSRNIAAANASMRAGEWNRKAFSGTQVAGKTLAVIGLGRIGRAVAERGTAFEMRVLGYDPFYQPKGDESFEHVTDLDELCKRADYLTVHVPKTADTAGMISTEQFKMMKPTARVINAARGGVIDPEALLVALNDDEIAAAAIDVYTSEPPTNEAEVALVNHPKTVCVPHLGASTAEAQDQVAVDAAVQLVEALRGGAVRNAINAPGFGEAIPELLKPFLELAPRMGTIVSTIATGTLKKLEITCRGDIADLNIAPVKPCVLMGLLAGKVEETVNVINAGPLAEERGLDVALTSSKKAREFANLLEVKVTTDKGTHTVLGTIFGNKYPRVISIDGYSMEMRPEGDVVILVNDDTPGAISKFTSVLAEAGLNIADLTLSRKQRLGTAMVGLNLDDAPADEVVAQLKALDCVEGAWAVQLPPLAGTE
ncbi:MAG: phosphoglycerate dehydrogenase [Phycisphaerales bacterium]|jgi:D-3-phosphoglycerate dehydrogenase / 2-oxoglutarate reductase|nr:phosphoglycerate dehydrogenase [Phycisphaerales bacterium]MBT7171721.1 phosphoglycerate dehydrogenase [Phycisphaerales bacterium]